MAQNETWSGDDRGPPSAPAPPVHGGFELRERLGAGGMGEVWLADQPALRREVVVKVLKAHSGGSRANRRMLREARLAARLEHPYAAHVYAVGEEPDGVLWIAMEYVRGTPLDRLLRERRSLPAEVVGPLARRLAEVLGAAHGLGVIHRDVKPGNVIVQAASGQLFPKLVDFGIARLRGDEQDDDAPVADPRSTADHMTGAGVSLGTPAYMAPEQWRDARTAGPAADQYSLAVLLYEALTGAPPFAGSLASLRASHEREAVPPTGDEAADAVLRRALAKSPGDRFPDVVSFAAALEAALGTSTALEVPLLAGAVDAELLASLPRPIAECAAAVLRAATPAAAVVAIRETARATARTLGALAVVGWSRTAADPPPLLRALARRRLGTAEWVALGAELCDRGPSPLTAAYAEGGAARLAERVEAADPELRRWPDPADLRALLQGLDVLREWHLVLRRGAVYELLQGLAPGVHPRSPADTTSSVPEGHVAWIGPDGDAVDLWPLLQLRAGLGTDRSVFVFEGPGPGGHLVARPFGFEVRDDAAPDWLVSRLPADTATAPEPEPLTPWRGLLSYAAADAGAFFGREREVEAFTNRLRARGFAIVVGRSGVGKSSFVLAGVLPALGDPAPIVLRPGPEPLAALVAAVGAAGIPTDGLSTALAGWPEALGHALRLGGGARTLVVDQLEELFTLGAPPDVQERFAAAVARASSSEPPVRVICTLREDFLARAGRVAALRDRLDDSISVLSVPVRDELVRVLTGPAGRAGYTFEDPTMPARMVDEVAENPAALPLLSFAGTCLWELRDRADKTLPASALARVGGVVGALVRHADRVLSGLDEADRGLAREAFERLITSDGTRARVPRAELRTILGGDAVLERLVASRLVLVDGDDRVELAHESLIHTWPTLARWRLEAGESVRFREQLGAAARQWTERGRPSWLLWRGDALAEYRRWLDRGLTLAPEERSFGAASEAEALRGRRLRQLGSAAGILVLVAVSVGLGWAWDRARRAAARAEAEGEAARLEIARQRLEKGRDLLVRDDDPMGALVYLSDAYAAGLDTPGSRFMLGWASRLVDTAVLERTDLQVEALDAVPGRFAVCDLQGVLRFFEDGGAEPLAELDVGCVQPAFVPGGGAAWVLGREGWGLVDVASGSFARIDTADGAHPAAGGRWFQPRDGVVRWPDGREVALDAPPDVVGTWSPAGADFEAFVTDREVWVAPLDGSAARRWAHHVDRPAIVGGAADGSALGFLGVDGTVAIWDPNGRELFRRPIEGASRLSIGPGARRAIVLGDNTYTTVDLEGGATTSVAVGARIVPTPPQFLDGHRAVYGLRGRASVTLLDGSVDAGRLYAGTSIPGHVSIAGDRVVTLDHDGTLRWHAPERVPARILRLGSRQGFASVMLSPFADVALIDDAVVDLASGARSPSRSGVREWPRIPLAGGALVGRSADGGSIWVDRGAGRTTIPVDGVFSWFVPSPDGRSAVVAVADEGLRQLDLTTGQVTRSHALKPFRTGQLSISPDGSRVAGDFPFEHGGPGSGFVWDLDADTLVELPRAIAPQFSADGRRVIAMWPGHVWVYDVDGRELAHLDDPAMTLPYGSAVEGPPGFLVLNDDQPAVWDLDSGKPVARLEPTWARGIRMVGPDTIGTIGRGELHWHEWDAASDTRTPAEVAAWVRCHVPLRLEGGELVAAPLDCGGEQVPVPRARD